MTPALHTKTSSLSCLAANARANPRTDAKSAKSHAMTSTRAFGLFLRISSLARSPRETSRTAMTTTFPSRTAAAAVSTPSPAFAPVTTTTGADSLDDAARTTPRDRRRVLARLPTDVDPARVTDVDVIVDE